MENSQKSLDNEKLATLFFDYLKKEHNISEKALSLLFKQEESISVPISILSDRKVGCFEAIVKYLRDNLDYSIKEISKLTNSVDTT